MKLEWLEDILAIAQTGSFSGAAELRRLTQSAFSRRIQQIEDYVGVELFDRSHKPIRLQPTTLAQSEQILLLAAGLRQLVLDLRRGDRITSNSVVIACQHSLTTVRIPPLLQRLRRQDENIYVKVRSANLDECNGLILSRQADVAIIYRLPDESNQVDADYLEVVTIGNDRLIPVFSALLQQTPAALEMPYITYPADVFFGKVLERKILPFLHQATHHMPKVETALTHAAIEMAAAGIGVAWVPESLAMNDIKAGRLVDLSAVLPNCDLLVKAMRLQGKLGAAQAMFWSQLLAK